MAPEEKHIVCVAYSCVKGTLKNVWLLGKTPESQRVDDTPREVQSRTESIQGCMWVVTCVTPSRLHISGGIKAIAPETQHQLQCVPANRCKRWWIAGISFPDEVHLGLQRSTKWKGWREKTKSKEKVLCWHCECCGYKILFLGTII